MRCDAKSSLGFQKDLELLGAQVITYQPRDIARECTDVGCQMPNACLQADRGNGRGRDDVNYLEKRGISNQESRQGARDTGQVYPLYGSRCQNRTNQQTQLSEADFMRH